MKTNTVKPGFLSSFNETAPAAQVQAASPPEPTIQASALPAIFEAQARAEMVRAQALKAQAAELSAPVADEVDAEEEPELTDDQIRALAYSGDAESEDQAADLVFKQIQELQNTVEQERQLRIAAEQQALRQQALQVASQYGLHPSFHGYVHGTTGPEYTASITEALRLQEEFRASLVPAPVAAAPATADQSQVVAPPVAVASAPAAVPAISAPAAHAPAPISALQPMPGPLDNIPHYTSMESVRNGTYAKHRETLIGAIQQAAGNPAGQRWAFNPSGAPAMPPPVQGQTHQPNGFGRGAPPTVSVAGVSMPNVGIAPPATFGTGGPPADSLSAARQKAEASLAAARGRSPG